MKIVSLIIKREVCPHWFGFLTSPPFCIGDGSPIGVATENIKDASKLPTRGADAKGTV